MTKNYKQGNFSHQSRGHYQKPYRKTETDSHHSYYYSYGSAYEYGAYEYEDSYFYNNRNGHSSSEYFEESFVKNSHNFENEESEFRLPPTGKSKKSFNAGSTRGPRRQMDTREAYPTQARVDSEKENKRTPVHTVSQQMPGNLRQEKHLASMDLIDVQPHFTKPVSQPQNDHHGDATTHHTQLSNNSDIKPDEDAQNRNYAAIQNTELTPGRSRFFSVDNLDEIDVHQPTKKNQFSLKQKQQRQEANLSEHKLSDKHQSQIDQNEMSIDNREIPIDIYLNVAAENYFDQVQIKPQPIHNAQPFFPSGNQFQGDFGKKFNGQQNFRQNQFHKKSNFGETKQNPYAFKNNRRILTKDYKIKKKTELCSSFKETSFCKYGDNCAFAHGEHELQKKVHVPSMYKTKLCQQYHYSGHCPYGHRCQFIHSDNMGELIKKEQEEEQKSLEAKKAVSFKQMLFENAQCLNDRIKSSHNPYLNEFNLVYKDFNTRMPVFAYMTSEQASESQVENPNEQLMQQYLHLEAQLKELNKKFALPMQNTMPQPPLQYQQSRQ